MFLEKIKLLKSDYPDYNDIVGLFGFKIEVVNEDDDYSGDSRYLLRDDERFGVLTFGWGSCSGCDALLDAHGNADNVNKLAEELFHSIRWFDDAGECLHYFNTHDWKGDYSFSSEFNKECIKLLEFEAVDKILLENESAKHNS